MNRRDFLTIPQDASGDVTPDVVRPSIAIVSKPTAGFPRDYTRHEWVLVEDVHAWLVRDSLGFYAIDAACSHLGCVVRPHDSAFFCPCHNSTFTADGSVTNGPARRPLRFLMVDLDVDGKLLIRRDQVVSPDDRFIA